MNNNNITHVDGDETYLPSSGAKFATQVCISTPNLVGAEEKATGNKNSIEMMVNPFRRNSGIQRSPPKTVSHSTQEMQGVSSNAPTAQSSVNSSFVELGNLISKLAEYVKSKTNVHHAIKEQIRAIGTMYCRAKEEEASEENKQPLASREQSTQTTPNTMSVTSDLKRGRELADSPTKLQKPKRVKKVNEKPTMPKEREIARLEEAKNKEENTTWKTVKRKKKQGKQKQRKPAKTDAMIISARGENTYADILRKIRADPTLQDLGESVSRIRRTQKGDLLLEIKTGSKEVVGKFHSQVEKSIGMQADIRTHRQEILIECRDMDEVTTKQEILVALMKQFEVEGINEADIKSIRKCYGDTQTAIISLPIDIGRKMIQAGKVKIGWVICRIREKVSLKRCYRFLEFGHIAANCTNEHDRRGMCRRCGVAGHIAKDCTQKPQCMFCRLTENADTLHVAGSGRCPVFKKALNGKRK